MPSSPRSHIAGSPVAGDRAHERGTIGSAVAALKGIPCAVILGAPEQPIR